MSEHVLIGLSSIIILGIVAQWLAWRLRLPAILLLLIFGFVVGPVTGFLEPDALLGDLLLPIVSISVALILFEGSLGLKVAELRAIGSVVRNLITVGALASWLIGALSAYFIAGLNLGLAVLIGAILVVTGPTVIGPLLRHVQPVARIGSILKWESILIDPVGAVLAVLVYEAILTGGIRSATSLAVLGFLKTVFIGGLMGMIGAAIIVLLMKRYWVPDFLQNAVSVAVVISIFAASNIAQAESGLLAVTVMGIALANQKAVTVKHIIEFKENLRVLLLAGLFILLAARLRMSDVTQLGVRSLIFLAALILVARPVCVALSTIGSGLKWKERLLLACVAPRGIVAAAISSIFALRMADMGNPQAERLVPLTFLVIVGTVTIYGLAASPAARKLKLSNPDPQGVMIVGAHRWARLIAAALEAQGFQVLLVDTNRSNLYSARLAGLPTYYGSILSDYALDEIELDGIGRLLALTSNDAVNSLACLHFIEVFGRAEVYQLSPKNEGDARKEAVASHQRGRLLFDSKMTYQRLNERFEAGATVKTTKLTQEFDFNSFRSLYGDTTIPLFVITETGAPNIVTADKSVAPRPGQVLISLVMNSEAATAGMQPGVETPS